MCSHVISTNYQILACPTKMLFECDGSGKIRMRPHQRVDKLRKEGKITEDEYTAANEAELKKLKDS